MIRRYEIWCLILSGVALGALTGGVMNALNGLISPDYCSSLYYRSSEDSAAAIWRNGIEQGTSQGLVFGLLVSFFVIVCVYATPNLKSLVRAGFLIQSKIVLCSFVFWLTGGLDSVLIAHLWPGYGDIINLAFGDIEYLKAAWVVGSIWGAYLGIVPATIGCLFPLALKQRHPHIENPLFPRFLSRGKNRV